MPNKTSRTSVFTLCMDLDPLWPDLGRLMVEFRLPRRSCGILHIQDIVRLSPPTQVLSYIQLSYTLYPLLCLYAFALYIHMYGSQRV